MIKTRGKVIEVEARYWLTQVLSGLDHLHNNGIIHSDLCLENFHITEEMQVKVGGIEKFVPIEGVLTPQQ
jgi:serine/threonine protein kinase